MRITQLVVSALLLAVLSQNALGTENALNLTVDGGSIIHHSGFNATPIDTRTVECHDAAPSALYVGGTISENGVTTMESRLSIDTRELTGKNVKAATLYVCLQGIVSTKNAITFTVVNSAGQQTALSSNTKKVKGSYQIVKEFDSSEIWVAIPLNQTGIGWINRGQITDIVLESDFASETNMLYESCNIVKLHSSGVKKPFLKVAYENMPQREVFFAMN